MAGDDGFEPPMSESKSDALTTWLIPNVGGLLRDESNEPIGFTLFYLPPTKDSN